MNLTMERLFLNDEGGDALNINADGSLNAVVSGEVNIGTMPEIDVRDLSHLQDSIKIGDGTDFLGVNADGSINAVVSATALDIRPLTNADVVTAEQGTNPWIVSATDLDIRNLAYANDSVTAHQGGTWSVDAVQSGTWSVTASATDFDIRDLAYASDSVTAHQGGTWAVDATLAAPNGSMLNSVKALTDVAAALVASSLSGRKQIIIQNKGAESFFIGDSAVSAANGIEVAKGSSFATESGPGQVWYAVCASGKSSSARILEQA